MQNYAIRGEYRLTPRKFMPLEASLYPLLGIGKEACDDAEERKQRTDLEHTLYWSMELVS